MGRHSAVVVPVLVTHSQLMFPWKTVENDKKKPKKKQLIYSERNLAYMYWVEVWIEVNYYILDGQVSKNYFLLISTEVRWGVR